VIGRGFENYILSFLFHPENYSPLFSLPDKIINEPVSNPRDHHTALSSYKKNRTIQINDMALLFYFQMLLIRLPFDGSRHQTTNKESL